MKQKIYNSICMLSFSPMIFDTRIQREAKALKEAGYVIKIFYIEDQEFLKGIPNLTEAFTSYNESMQGIESNGIFLISRMWKWAPKTIRYFFQAIELLFKFSFIVLFNKTRFYHCHDLRPAFFCWLAKAFHGSYIIYDAHELETAVANKRIQLLLKWYERFIVTKSSSIITVNEEITKIMSNEYKREINIIQNRPLFVDYSAIQENILQKTLKILPNSKILMYVGFLTKNIRGIELTIKSMALLPDNVYFLIMGVGRILEFKKYLKNIISEAGIQEQRIIFIGPYPSDEIVHYLHGADISVMLYQANTDNAVSNAPNKFFQSVMARTPMLASNNKTFPKYIYENSIGIIGETVDEKVPEKIAKKILFMLDGERQKKYRENCEKLAAEVSWETEAKKLLEIYSKITNSKSLIDFPV